MVRLRPSPSNWDRITKARMLQWFAIFGSAEAAVKVERVSKDATPTTLSRLLLLSLSLPEEIMTRLSWLQRLYWRYLSKPANERDLFLYVLENPISSILEIGIGSGERAKRVLPLCTKSEGIAQIRYAGVDPFESAAAGQPHLNLKQAHRMLAELGVKAHLIPGEPQSALSRVVSTVQPSDLILIDGQWGNGSDAANAIQSWLPRLGHSGSAIFASQTVGGPLVRQATPESSPAQSSLQRAA